MTHETDAENPTGTDALDNEDLDLFLDELFAELDAESSNEDEEEVVAGYDWEAEKAELLTLLDGPYKELRDKNQLNEAVLVWDKEKVPEVFEVPVLELPFVLPLKGLGTRWVTENFGEVLEEKATLLRQSKVAHELLEEVPTSSPVCGSVVVVVPSQTCLPYRWAVVKACLCPLVS